VIAATVFKVLLDALSFVRTALHSHRQLAAENLFLRKQLALYIERQTKPRRATDGTRLTLVMLARFIDWRPVLTIVQPDTLVRWHRQTFRLLWRWKLVPLGGRRYPRRSSS
jgi:putative transposase